MEDQKVIKFKIEVDVVYSSKLSVEYFKDYQVEGIVDVFAANFIRDQILTDRTPEQKEFDNKLGITVLSESEAVKYIERIEAVKKDNPVKKQMDMYREDFQLKIIETVKKHDNGRVINCHFKPPTASTFTITKEAFDFALKPKWQKALLQISYGLGVMKPAKSSYPNGPSISMRSIITGEGSSEFLQAIEDEIRQGISADWVKVESTVTQIVVENYKQAIPFEQLVEQRKPLLMLGEQFFTAIKEMAKFINEENSEQAFACANDIAKMFKENPDLVKIFMHDKEYPHCKVPHFEGNNTRRVTASILSKISETVKNKDMDGLTNLFFEYAPSGIYHSLTDQAQRLKGGIKPSKFYCKEFACVFGDVENARFHFIAWNRENSIPKSKRLKELYQGYQESTDGIVAKQLKNDRENNMDESEKKLSF